MRASSETKNALTRAVKADPASARPWTAALVPKTVSGRSEMETKSSPISAPAPVAVAVKYSRKASGTTAGSLSSSWLSTGRMKYPPGQRVCIIPSADPAGCGRADARQRPGAAGRATAGQLQWQQFRGEEAEDAGPGS